MITAGHITITIFVCIGIAVLIAHIDNIKYMMQNSKNKTNIKNHLKKYFHHDDKNKFVSDGVISSIWHKTETKINEYVEHFPYIIIANSKNIYKYSICGNIHLKAPIWLLGKSITRSI